MSYIPTDEDFSRYEKKQTIKPNITEDVLNSIGSFPSYATNIIGELPNELNEAIHMQGIRPLKNIGKGIEDTAKFAFNPAGPMMKYLGEKDIPYISALGRKWPQFPEDDLFGLGEQQPGDAIFQMIAPGGVLTKATKGMRGFKGLATRAGGAGAYAGSQGENPLHAALLSGLIESSLKGAHTREVPGFKSTRDLFNIKNIEEQAANSEHAYQGAENAEHGFQDYLRDIYKTKEPASLNSMLKTKLQKQAELEAQNPYDISLHEQPEINLSNRLMGRTGHELIPEAEKNTASQLSELSHYLGKGQQNDVLYQNVMNQMIKGNRSEIGAGYNKLKSTFENKNVTVPQSRSIGEIQTELSNLIKNGGLESKEVQELVKEMDSHKGSNEVPASSLLTQYRTADKLAKQAFDKSYERNQSLTEQQREEFRSLGNKYKEQAEKLSNVLEDQVHPSFKSELKNLNSQWRRYASLYKNPTGREIEAQRGIAGKNIFQKIRGSDPAQQLLQELTLSNPEATRAAIGHFYAENPGSLLNAPEYEQQFIKNNAHIPGYLQRIKEAQAREQIAQKQAEHFKLQNEAQKVQFENDVQLEQAKAQARQLASQVEQLNKDLKQYDTIRKNKDLSYKQKIEANAKYENTLKNLNRIKTVAKNLSYLAVIGVADAATRKAFSILFK